MTARYLVRFDDICPTMNWAVWERVELILLRYGVRPILAVVPDNRDQRLCVDREREDFWAQVQQWHARGWVIGWHGYQHVYSTSDAGIMGIHRGSEFAGYGRDDQCEKLQQSFRLFKEHGIHPQVWVAPGHSFDMTTVNLLPEFGVRIVSDGFYWRVLKHGGCTWVPQQLWRFRRLPFGVWTVCFHFNSWREVEIKAFERQIAAYARRIVALESLLDEEASTRGITDSIFSQLYRLAVVARQTAADSG